MTVCALGSKIRLVFVIFQVTRQAIHLELVFINIPFVAIGAFDIAVLSM
jgi:hypothetical protein